MSSVTDLKDFINKLQVEFGYARIMSDIRNNMIKAYDQRVKDYAKGKNSIRLSSVPEIVPIEKIQSDDFLVNNTTFIKQAVIFGGLAKEASREIKPLLYHYAENSLFAFFVYSLFSYPTYSMKHGLKIIWGKTWNDTKVKVENDGFFSRIIDCYTILGVNTHFSALRYENLQNSFMKNPDNKYPFSDEPQLSIHEIIDIRQKIGRHQNGHYYDIIDFILLFYSSTLARYRPSFWHKIIEGKEGDEIIFFEKCFDRFDILLRRLVRVLFKASWNIDGTSPPYPLDSFDIEITQRGDDI